MAIPDYGTKSELWGNFQDAWSLLGFLFMCLGIIILIWSVRAIIHLIKAKKKRYIGVIKRHPRILMFTIIIININLIVRPAIIYVFFVNINRNYMNLIDIGRWKGNVADINYFNHYISLFIEYFGTLYLIFLRIWILYTDSIRFIEADSSVETWVDKFGSNIKTSESKVPRKNTMLTFNKSFNGFITKYFVKRNNKNNILLSFILITVYFLFGFAVESIIFGICMDNNDIVKCLSKPNIFSYIYYSIPLVFLTFITILLFKQFNFADDLWLRKEQTILLVVGWCQYISKIIIEFSTLDDIYFRLLSELLLLSITYPLIAWVTSNFGTLCTKTMQRILEDKAHAKFSKLYSNIIIEHVLSVQSSFFAFASQCISELSLENLLFSVELTQYVQYILSKYPNLDASKFKNDLHKIQFKWLNYGNCYNEDILQYTYNLYDKYIDPNSANCVNISMGARKRIETFLGKNYDGKHNDHHLVVSYQEKRIQLKRKASANLIRGFSFYGKSDATIQPETSKTKDKNNKKSCFSCLNIDSDSSDLSSSSNELSLNDMDNKDESLQTIQETPSTNNALPKETETKGEINETITKLSEPNIALPVTTNNTSNSKSTRKSEQNMKKILQSFKLSEPSTPDTPTIKKQQHIKIVSKKLLHAKCLHIFNRAQHHVYQNLNDSFSRFKTKNEFIMLRSSILRPSVVTYDSDE